jgi:hypothetical protein
MIVATIVTIYVVLIAMVYVPWLVLHIYSKPAPPPPFDPWIESTFHSLTPEDVCNTVPLR